MVPPRGKIPRTSETSNGAESPSSAPRQPSRNPTNCLVNLNALPDNSPNNGVQPRSPRHQSAHRSALTMSVATSEDRALGETDGWSEHPSRLRIMRQRRTRMFARCVGLEIRPKAALFLHSAAIVSSSESGGARVCEDRQQVVDTDCSRVPAQERPDPHTFARSRECRWGSALGRARIQSAPNLRRVHAESAQQHRRRIWWLESEDLGQYLLGRDIEPPTVGLRRFLKHFLCRGRDAEAILLRDISDPRLLRHGAHRQWGSVGARPQAQGAQGFLIERLKSLASLLQTHAQHVFDRGILEQSEQDVIGAISAITSATSLLTGLQTDGPGVKRLWRNGFGSHDDSLLYLVWTDWRVTPKASPICCQTSPFPGPTRPGSPRPSPPGDGEPTKRAAQLPDHPTRDSR